MKKRKSPAKEKLMEWVEKNPDGYLKKSYEDIGKEIGIAPISVWRHLPSLIADRDGMLPSQVMEQRKEQGLEFGKKHTLKPEKIEKIYELSKSLDAKDIAYTLDIDMRTVEKYLKDKQEQSNERENIQK